MKLTKPQKGIILISIFWTIIAAITSQHTDRYQSYISFDEFFFLMSPAILYWSGVWIWGFGYLKRFFYKLSNSIKKLRIFNTTKKEFLKTPKSNIKKETPKKEEKTGIGRIHYVIVTIINNLAHSNIHGYIIIGLPWQLAVIFLRCRNLNFNWIIPSIVYTTYIGLITYLSLEGIDISSYSIDKTNPLYGLASSAMTLQFIFMIYNLIFIFKPGKK